MITNSLLSRIETLDYSENMINEAIMPALRVYVQSDTALRIHGVADLKLKPFRSLTDFSHLRANFAHFEDDVKAIEIRRNNVRRRLVSMGIDTTEITQAAYSATSNGEIYAFVVKSKKLVDKDRHLERTQAESDAINQIKQAAAMVKELEAMVQSGQTERAAEKHNDVIQAMMKSKQIMQSDAFRTADAKRKLKDSGREYVYFIHNEMREGKRAVSTVYESQLPESGNEFIAYKVVIGTKKR